MKLYLDTSALVKLIQQESESAALRRYLHGQREDERFTSALARTELVRAVFAAGPRAVSHARRVLARTYEVRLDRSLLDTAGTLATESLVRGLDAIHLASAMVAGSDLRTVLTYDHRMIQAAHELGLETETPV